MEIEKVRRPNLKVHQSQDWLISSELVLALAFEVTLLQLRIFVRFISIGLLLASCMASPSATSNMLRSIQTSVKGSKMMEGAGVMICRTVGTAKLRNLDPFLMLDELKLPASQAFAGFPDHPHRGFETCSIMLSGVMEHKDSAGNHGIIRDGGVQWMTAGRGIIHSEMPAVSEGTLHGFQLWINLPAKDKMCKPRYQDYQEKDIPIKESPDGLSSVRVMAGDSMNTTGPIVMRNPGCLLDFRIKPGGVISQKVPSEWNGFVYVYQGAGEVSGSQASIEHAMVLGPGDHITAKASENGLNFLLIAGRPIGEPIVQHGPFVMNTQQVRTSEELQFALPSVCPAF